jgi:PiT family inorganic phosphate transporter
MFQLLSIVNLPFIGEIDLPVGILIIFLLCILCVISFEFVNGFHDTANAVATVIYTKAMKPMVAVPWSGVFNFLGVFTGGVAVAMGILKLIPLYELTELPVQVGACMVLAILIASIIWNLGTWYFGIPCSSSHTLIGAMIGGSLAFTYYYGGGGVNWNKAAEIGLSLILSPLFGFGASVLLMYFLKNVIKAKSLFHIPEGKDKPPFFIRLLLITTCTLVSFFHGSNDGQKGVGLLMLVLIAFLPAKFVMNNNIPKSKMQELMHHSKQICERIATNHPEGNPTIDSAITLIGKMESYLSIHDVSRSSEIGEIFKARKLTQATSAQLKAVGTTPALNLSAEDKIELIYASNNIGKITDYAPVWVIGLISLSLGLGTMIGWKRIVLTIGEKIGKEHLNYAQGASAEIVAAATIGLSTGLGLPVSTTHVLSSGIAGSMVASKGTKNLNNATLKSIAMAWILTLPVSIILAIILFVVFHLFV